MDGQVDYSSYSEEELRQALRFIDRQRYPLNFQRIQSELAARAQIASERIVESASAGLYPDMTAKDLLAKALKGLPHASP